MTEEQKKAIAVTAKAVQTDVAGLNEFMDKVQARLDLYPEEETTPKKPVVEPR